MLLNYFCFNFRMDKISDKINNSIGIAMASITGSLFTLLLINTSDPYLFSFFLVIDSAFAIGGQLILMNIFHEFQKRTEEKYSV